MCSECDEIVALLAKTKGINSGDFTYVEFTFPNGTPKLVRAGDKAVDKDEH